MTRLTATLLTAIALLTASPVPAKEPSPSAASSLADQVKLEYGMFTIENGLTTIVYTDHSTPTVYVGMYYDVGSKDEPPGKTGFAHLFEHLMFQGTANRDGEYFTPFAEAGATGMNGTTNQDRTNYFATVPTGALDMALWMESDRMGHLLGAVTQEVLDEQRDVVKNEKREGENQPYSSMFDRVLEAIHPPGHPYRHSPIGSMEDLDNASVEDVHAWFRKYYGASNALLVLAGDIDIETAREKVAYYFSGAPAGEPLTKRKEWVSKMTETRRDIVYDRVGQTRLVLAWPIPRSADRDATLMYLVNETLVRNKNAPLYSKLVDELQWATNVSSSAMGQVLSGLELLVVDLRPGVEPDEVYRVIDETLRTYFAEGPDAELLDNAKLAVNMMLIGSMESKATIGSLLAEGQLFAGNPLQIKQDLEWLNEASTEDLKRAADRWLSGHRYELTFLPFPELASSETGVDRSAIPPVGEVGGVQFPPVESVTLDNGARLVVARREAILLIDVHVSVGTGQMSNTEAGSILSEAAWVLLNRGTRQFDANELAAEKDRIAMSTRSSPGREASSISYPILSAYLGKSLELVVEMLKNPTFPDHELEKFKANVNAILDNIERNPARMAGSYFTRAIFGPDHALSAAWTREALAAVTQKDLLGFMQREVAPDNITVYMVGDVSLDEAAAQLEHAMRGWDATHRSARRAVGPAPEAAPRVILVDQPGAVQSTIYAGHAIRPFSEDEATELSVMNAILGGSFESRIMMNLREDKGWTYGLSSSIARNTSGDQVIAASGAVQIDKTVESMLEIRHEFEQLREGRPATRAELRREVLNGTRSIPGQFQNNSGFLGSIVNADFYGLPHDHAEGRAARLAALKLRDINRQARETLLPDRMTWVVVGDLSLIETPIRDAGFGRVEIWDAYGNQLR